MRRYNFSARAEEVAELRALARGDLLAWYRSAVAPGGADRRKLCIHVAGRSQAAELAAPPPSPAGRPSVPPLHHAE